MAQSIQHQRFAKGLCPACGADAAPYYYCGECRAKNLLRRVLNKGVQAGTFQRKISDRDHRYKAYAIGNKAIPFEYREAQEGDTRLAPRRNHIPIDIAADVERILREAGHPMTEAEITEAWKILRPRPERLSPARDLVTIIQAQRKRQRKAQR
jgi:hypothetical protein